MFDPLEDIELDPDGGLVHQTALVFRMPTGWPVRLRVIRYSFPNAISDFDDEVINRAGQTFNQVPKFTSFVAIQYSWPLDAGDAELLQGWITPRFEWYYQSEIHLNGPELERSVQPGYNLLNAGLSYDFWDDRAQVALWGKNLADQECIVYSTPTVSTFGFLVNYLGTPRTFGAELSYRF